MAHILALAAIFLLFIPSIFYLITKNLPRPTNRRPPLPPGPKGWPIVGSLITILRNKPSFRYIHGLMSDMHTDIMCFRLGGVHVITITSPAIAREFLKKQDANFSSRPVIMSAGITSGGFLTTALSPMGDQWKKMRKILASKVLSNAKHKWLQAKRMEEADHLVKYVFNKSGWSSGVVNVRIATQHYAANVIRKMIFSKRFFGKGAEDGGPGAEEIEHVFALFTTLKYTFSFCISDYFPWLRTVSSYVFENCSFLARIPLLEGIFDLDGHRKILLAANASIKKFEEPEVDERIHQWAIGTRKHEEDILDILIRLKDDAGNPFLTVEEIKAQITELIIGAVDNVSNAVEWALAEMISKPNMLWKAWDELDQIVGRDRLVQEEDLPQLNYVKACIREAFRLHPFAPFNVPHVSIKDTEVCGYFIPKGSHVLLSRPGLGRSAEAWEDPFRYDPERHLVEGREVVFVDHDLNMLTFSTGRRGCVGALLGTTMTAMLLARLLQAFTWEVPSTEQKIDLSESKEELLMAKPLVALVRPRLPKHLYALSE